MIIDPGGDEKNITNCILENNSNVCAIINTHAHYDHIGAVNYLKNKYSVPFYLHSKDEKLLQSANFYMKVFEGTNYIKIPEVDFFIDHMENLINIANFSIEILFTPGHTYGSVCLLIENCLFTGDTLFKGEIGRTDLPGGNEDILKKSLKTISMLPKYISIYAGHGAPSTIEEELKHNRNFIQAL